MITITMAGTGNTPQQTDREGAPENGLRHAIVKGLKEKAAALTKERLLSADYKRGDEGQD